MHLALSYETLLQGIRVKRARRTAVEGSSVRSYRKLVDDRKRATDSSEILDNVVRTIAAQKKYNEEFKRNYFRDLVKNLS